MFSRGLTVLSIAVGLAACGPESQPMSHGGLASAGTGVGFGVAGTAAPRRARVSPVLPASWELPGRGHQDSALQAHQPPVESSRRAHPPRVDRRWRPARQECRPRPCRHQLQQPEPLRHLRHRPTSASRRCPQCR
jgi:hypothetical protein